MKIRQFCESDRSDLIKLWHAVFPDDPSRNEPSKVIESKLAIDNLIFIAEHEGLIIGACMAGYDGHRGGLYAVAVCKEQRRSGAGSALVQHAIQALKVMGCIKVNLQIRATNTQVTTFYESLGFVIEERLSMGTFIG